MAEITPTPRAGTWLESTGVGYPADTQPRAGSWLKMDGLLAVQPRAGSWLKMDGSLAVQPGIYRDGRVHLS